MFKAISQIDLFGKGVLFTYRGNSKSKSRVGAIFTLILFGFIIWLLVYFGQALFDKSNPRATSFESFNVNPSAIPLTTDNFVFAFGIADPITLANYINESIFTVHASTYKTVRTLQADGTVQISYEQLPLEIEPCRTDHFGDLADQFSYVALDQIYCLKKEQPNLETDYPILQGNFESPIYSSIFVHFQECDSNTSTVSCATQDERDKLLKGGYLSLVFSNIAIDMTDAQKPLKKFRDSAYTTVDNSFYKEFSLYLEQLEINTDDGWLTTAYETNNYVKFGEIKEFLSLTSNKYFANFIMRLSNVKKHYNRSYTKVQEIIAQVNGIITVTFTVLFLALAPYVRLKFYEALINEIFDIKTSKLKRNGNITRKKTAKAIKRQNSNNTKNNDTGKPQPGEKPQSQEDLEQQRLPSKHKKDIVNNVGNVIDISVKGGPSLEEPAQINLSATILSQPLASPNQSSIIELQERKEKSPFSRFKGLAEIPLNMSRLQSENGPLNAEPTSPLASPQCLKRELISPRKPNFLKPNFKLLDYEDHGEDFFETILKNSDQDNIEPKKVTNQEREDGYQNTKMETREGKYKETWPRETILSDNEEDKEPKEEIEKNVEEQRKYRLQKLETIGGKRLEGINLSFCEYLRSCFSKSEAIKEKMYLLNEGIERINERLDIFNLFKKLREFDKLKVLLLEDEQFVLFDSLPRPELAVKTQDGADNSGLISQSLIKDAQFIQSKRKKGLILMSYERLKCKNTPTMIDKKLYEIYDNRVFF